MFLWKKENEEEREKRCHSHTLPEEENKINGIDNN